MHVMVIGRLQWSWKIVGNDRLVLCNAIKQASEFISYAMYYSFEFVGELHLAKYNHVISQHPR